MSQEISIILDLKSAQALQKLSSFVESAAAGLKALATQAAAAYLSFEGFRKLEEGVRDAINLQEEIGRLAQKTGLSVEPIIALREAALKVNVPFESLSTGLSLFAQKIFEAATVGGTAADMFKRLGISLVNSDGTLKSMDALLSETLQRFHAMPDGIMKTAAAAQLFGKAGRDLIPALNEGAEAISRFREEGSPITPESVAQATAFNQKLRNLHEVLEMVFVQLANKLLPTLTRTADGLMDLTKTAKDNEATFQGVAETLKGTITVVLFATTAFSSLAAIIGSEAFVATSEYNVALSTLKALLQDVKALAGDLVQVLLDYIRGAAMAVEISMDVTLGKWSEAKKMVGEGLASLKMDVLRLVGDGAGAAEHVMSGAVEQLSTYKAEHDRLVEDLKQKWAGFDLFVKKLWSDETPKPMPHSNAGPAETFTPVNNDSIKVAEQMRGIVDELFKQEQQLIQGNPWKEQLEKERELIPLLEKQKTLVEAQYAAAFKQASNPNLTDLQKAEALKELVRLRGQYITLEQQEAKLQGQQTFKGQFASAFTDIKNRWGSWSQQMASSFESVFNSAIESISRGISKLIEGTITWRQALTEIGSAILDTIIQSMVRMVVQWAITTLLMAVIGDATMESMAVTASSAWAGPAILASIATEGEAAAIGPTAVMGAMAFSPAIAAMGAAGREFGGPVTAGVPYVVGEKRMELFVPDRSGYVYPRVPAPAPMVSGSAGPGAGQQTHIHLSFHGGEAAAKRWAQSQEGQSLIVDTNKRTVNRVVRT